MIEHNKEIRDIVVPLDRYPHLNENQTLQEAIDVFMSFQTGESNGVLYSTLLVVNDDFQLVGRLTLLDVLEGLAPKLFEAAKVVRFEGKGAEYPNLAFLYEESTFAKCGQNRLKPLKGRVREIDFSLPADTNILKALVMMADKNDFTVPVTDGGDVIGILRLEEIFHAMCQSYCAL